MTKTLKRLGNDTRQMQRNVLLHAWFHYLELHGPDSPALFIAGTPRGGCTSMLEYVSDFEGANCEQEN